MSVSLHPGIHLVGPSQDSAREVDNTGIPGLLQELGDALAASAALTVNHDVAVAIDFRKAQRNVILRNELPANVGDLILEGLADIENEQVLARAIA